jgi:repressor LexA
MTKRMKDVELSTDERRTLAELQRLSEQQGFPPTVEELTASLKLRKSLVHTCLGKLINEGYVRKKPGKARGLEIVRSMNATVIAVVPIPVMGSVPAGVPINAEERYEGEVLVHSNLVGKSKCFALNVVGQSMCEADICDGDLVIVRQQPLAEDGDIVVASVDGEVTVKRLWMKEGCIRLLPANDEFEPIDIEPKTELRVLGKVIAVQRLLASAF